jgi:hypothetical protein
MPDPLGYGPLLQPRPNKAFTSYYGSHAMMKGCVTYDHTSITPLNRPSHRTIARFSHGKGKIVMFMSECL